MDYVNALEQVRLERLASELASVYAASGNDWDRFRERFEKLQRRVLPPRPGRPPPFTPEDGAPPKRAPPPGSPPPGPGPGLPLAGPPTALFDTAGESMAEPASADERVFRVPVLVNEVVVGELKSPPKRQLDTPQETAFARRQLIASLAIGIAALLIATVISLWLARTLLSPIRQMFGGVAALSGGDYGVRPAAQRDDELGRLMKDLNRLAETLENTQLSRRRWLADISHEVRTPVTILVGELEAIRDESSSNSSIPTHCLRAQCLFCCHSATSTTQPEQAHGNKTYSETPHGLDTVFLSCWSPLGCRRFQWSRSRFAPRATPGGILCLCESNGASTMQLHRQTR